MLHTENHTYTFLTFGLASNLGHVQCTLSLCTRTKTDDVVAPSTRPPTVFQGFKQGWGALNHGNEGLPGVSLAAYKILGSSCCGLFARLGT